MCVCSLFEAVSLADMVMLPSSKLSTVAVLPLSFAVTFLANLYPSLVTREIFTVYSVPALKVSVFINFCRGAV